MSEQSSENKPLPESEPYLGFSWAVAMFVLYILKELFPAETYSWLWWFQMYILAIILGITIFTLIKRYRHFKSSKADR
jgi:hypothetical protein